MAIKYKYLQFPLCLLQYTFKDQAEALNMILDYGIVNYAQKLPYTMQDVIKQLLYYYARKQDVLQSSIVDKLEEAGENELFTFDASYSGFNGEGEFNPFEEDIEQIQKLFSEDPQLEEDAILNYRLHLATSTNHLAITIATNDNTIRRYKRALKLKEDFERNFGPDAMPMCKKEMIFDFRDNPRDLNLFRAYIGIRSIIGMNNYIATHKTVILCRMMGCKTNKALAVFLKSSPEAKEVYTKFSGRKRMDNLLFKLCERGFITMASKKHESRIYLSIKYQTPMELVKAVIENREQNNLKKQLADAGKLL